MFTNEAGGGPRRNNFADVWRAATTRVDLGREATFHDLHHFYASLLIRQGADVKLVQERLGHASATETTDTYSHLWPDSEDRTRGHRRRLRPVRRGRDRTVTPVSRRELTRLASDPCHVGPFSGPWEAHFVLGWIEGGL